MDNHTEFQYMRLMDTNEQRRLDIATRILCALLHRPGWGAESDIVVDHAYVLADLVIERAGARTMMQSYTTPPDQSR